MSEQPQSEQQQCKSTPVGYPNWQCRLPAGHEGDHRRGPAHWPTEKESKKKK